MKLKELNTPFEKKRMLAYGRDGNTADISWSSESPGTCIKAGQKS